MEDLGAPSSYLELGKGAECFSCDGEKVGKVEHVLAVPEDDIFDGIVLDTSVLPGGHRFVMIKDSERAMPKTEINLVVNWSDELARRVLPTDP